MIDKKQRKIDLDFMRIMAILAVVGIHSVAPVVDSLPVDTLSWNVANLVDSALRWAVPIFVMISGAVLIRPSLRPEFRLFYSKRAYRLIIPLLAWPIIYYAIWYFYAYDKTVASGAFIEALLIGKPLVGYHLYFIFLIAGLYALAPFISLIAANTSKRQFKIATIWLLALTTIWYHLQVALPDNKISLNMVTQGLPYVGYFMLGYLMRDLHIEKRALTIVATILLILLGTIASFFTKQIFGSLVLYGYTSLYVMILSPLMFMSLRVIYSWLAGKLPPLKNYTLKLTPYIFGIFLVHVLTLNSFILVFGIDRKSLWNVPLIFLSTLVLSWGLTVVMSKVPYIRALVS